MKRLPWFHKATIQMGCAENERPGPVRQAAGALSVCGARLEDARIGTRVAYFAPESAGAIGEAYQSAKDLSKRAANYIA